MATEYQRDMAKLQEERARELEKREIAVEKREKEKKKKINLIKTKEELPFKVLKSYKAERKRKEALQKIKFEERRRTPTARILSNIGMFRQKKPLLARDKLKVLRFRNQLEKARLQNEIQKLKLMKKIDTMKRTGKLALAPSIPRAFMPVRYHPDEQINAELKSAFEPDLYNESWFGGEEYHYVNDIIGDEDYFMGMIPDFSKRKASVLFY